ncbi:GNAT family N-acetyltransferase [Enterobacter hormaechei]|nr:GNAT family N-acetyltransferase [Enterobacter hormaechei]
MLTNEHKLIAKVATSEYEIHQAMKLRYHVFSRKNIFPFSKENNDSKVDMDFLDRHCQHIVVIEKTTNKVIGTARFLEKKTALKNNIFLTNDGFDNTELMQVKDEFIEIGRVCVDEDYQSGNAFFLIKKEFNNFIRKHYFERKLFVIGMYSIEYSNDRELSGIYHYLKEKSNFSYFNVNAAETRGYKVMAKSQSVQITSDKQLPKLLRVYLSMGAKLLGTPCTDTVCNNILSISLPIVITYDV